MIYAIRRQRRFVIAAAVAALLGGAALLSASAPPASAAIHECPAGEFCLYFNEDANGGYYHFPRSDSDLNEDKYVGGGEGEFVGNTSRNASNNGVEDPAGKVNVIVYDEAGWVGARRCIEQDEEGALPTRWWHRIESYRWVTDSRCDAAPREPLDLGNHNLPPESQGPEPVRTVTSARGA